MHSFCWRSGRPRKSEPLQRWRATPPDPIQQGTGALQPGGFKEGEAAHRLGGIQGTTTSISARNFSRLVCFLVVDCS